MYIYNNDYQSLCTEVYKHQNIETGGNLFGLWTTSGSSVIHVLLGPGKDCRRTSTSFHQDIKYMERVGRFVNTNYMLCHIGEWHSHHRLSLSKPSVGDEQTIQRNFPQGMDKFLVVIANIVGRQGDQITLSPYFFTDNGRRYKKAEWEVLPTDSPFSSDKKILAQIEQGAETRWQRPKSPNKEVLVEISSHDEKTGNPSAPISNPLQASCTVDIPPPDYPGLPDSQARPSNLGSPDSQVNPFNPSSPDPQVNSVDSTEEPMDTSNDDLVIPDRDYEGPGPNTTTTSQAGVSRTSSDANQNTGADDNKPTDQEIALKKIHDALKKWFGSKPESKFSMETSKSTPGAVEIKFEHARCYWMIRFPENFPITSAKLFCDLWETPVRNWECSHDGDEPLKNEVNILVLIRENCMYKQRCDICKHFTKELLLPAQPSQPSTRDFAYFTNELVNEITNHFPDAKGLNLNVLSNVTYAEVTYEHGRWYWKIEVPVKFPDEPAKVYRLLYKGSSQKHDAFVDRKYSHGVGRRLVSIELIIKAIYTNCTCSKCVDKQRLRR